MKVCHIDDPSMHILLPTLFCPTSGHYAAVSSVLSVACTVPTAAWSMTASSVLSCPGLTRRRPPVSPPSSDPGREPSSPPADLTFPGAVPPCPLPSSDPGREPSSLRCRLEATLRQAAVTCAQLHCSLQDRLRPLRRLGTDSAALRVSSWDISPRALRGGSSGYWYYWADGSGSGVGEESCSSAQFTLTIANF